jgi:mannose-1-phosphate guanylyltransferase
MAGGAGTRFWPASRAAQPKQLLDLAGGETMIQATVSRLGNLVPPERTLVVTNNRLVDPITEQLPQLPTEAVIGEPCKRDTAPCVGLAAGWVRHRDPDATMVVMPADHVIRPDGIFREAISYAARLVQEQPGRLITFGIKPTYPAESFGYIERGASLDTQQDASQSVYSTFQVRRFREKPSAEVAQEYLDAGNFYWNSGIFVWKADAILAELAAHEPEMFAHLETISRALGAADFPQVLDQEFHAIQGKSIDYAVMERAADVAVIEAPFEWDDVGSWQALSRLGDTDQDGNTVIGRHLGLNTSGTIVRATDEHLVVTLGLTDCIVVHTPDATLVANKHDEESIRQVVQRLEEMGWDQYL